MVLAKVAATRHAAPFTAGVQGRPAKQPRAVSVTCSADRQVQLVQQVQDAVKNCLLGFAAAAVVAGAPALAPEQLAPTAQAGMLSRDPVKNAGALLRYALPIDNKPIRKVQAELEEISETLRIPGSKTLGKVAGHVRAASNVLDREASSITGALAPAKKEEGLAAIQTLKQKLAELQAAIDAGNKNGVYPLQQQALAAVGTIEEAMVKGFPFEIPSQYSNLPQLKGRATVEMKISFTSPRDDLSTEGVFRIVADGYNAPLSAGDFVDLVQRGFYNGMDIQRADGFVVQTGKPADAEGFVENGEVRRIPFEVMVQGDKEPVYEETLQDNGRYNEMPVLPFNAFGTLALARSEFEPNDASSQIFFLLKESELTPTGSNLLDGRYAVFGYIVDNADILKELQVGDKIEYAKVIDGLENLVEPKV